MAAGTAHYIAYSSRTGKPSHCAAGKKGEKMAADVAKANLPYNVRQIAKDHCPLCNPPAAEEQQEDAPAVVIPDEVRPGTCHMGCDSRPGQFRHKFMNGRLIRFCKDCGAGFDLETLKPWEE